MPGRESLTTQEREFFSLVSEAAFANPFGDERSALFKRIADGSNGLSDEDQRLRVTNKVKQRVETLISEGRNLGKYKGRDRDVIEITFLFDTYHRYLSHIDELILEQVKAGDEPCKVSFAPGVLGDLTRKGFSAADARQYFAMFYQFRRAYYFIEKQLVGRSPCMKDLRRHLWNNVVTHNIRWYARYLVTRMEDFSTLLLGETGTGKGTAARAIGRSGFIPFDERKVRFVESFTKAFVSINLSQFPESLIESELFGHTAGAFTGAREDHEGIFANCSPHGAIFLDEIGDVSTPVQIKLLQVLQERVFSPVGSHDRCRFEGRVVAATNRPLTELRESGSFRDDFFYRLSSDVISIPSLRQRLAESPEELDELLTHTISRLTGEAVELVEPIRETIRKTLPPDYQWPGNVRELEQCVRRILLTNRYDAFQEMSPLGANAEQFYEDMAQGKLNAQQLLGAYCRLLYEKFGTYAEVARRTALDRRTVRKYVEETIEERP